MKLKILAIGLVFAIIGIGLMAGYGVPSTTVRQQSIAYNSNLWDLNCSLTGGDNVLLLFRENQMWIHGLLDLTDDDPPASVLHVFIMITPIDPPGDPTQWDYQIAAYSPPSGGAGAANPQFVGWNITVMNDSGTLFDTSVWRTSKGKLTEVGGTVPFSGLYNAYLEVYPSRPKDEPPSFIGLYHNVTTTQYPYTYLLPAGGVTTIFGGTILFLGARSVPVRRSRIRRPKDSTETK
jgi:hypothetical protein